jgi:tRNA (cmo5U34)-methyltransferase
MNAAMQNKEIESIFNHQAATYDRQWAKLAPFRDAIHLLVSSIFGDLPAEAKVLCVGAGTGAEVASLAQRFPKWHFTAVDPAEQMVEVCRARIEALGLAARCTFHHGYVDSLPETEIYDAVTSFLVSQFILDREARSAYFRAIAQHLRPGGILVSSDLASDTHAPQYPDLLKVWFRTMATADLTPEALENMRQAYETKVAVLPPAKVEEIIKAGGFAEPVLFYQCGLIHGWFSRVG